LSFFAEMTTNEFANTVAVSEAESEELEGDDQPRKRFIFVDCSCYDLYMSDDFKARVMNALKAMAPDVPIAPAGSAISRMSNVID